MSRALLCFTLVVTAGCTSTAISRGRVEGPEITVFVVDVSTTHTALALPDGSSRYVLWGFGDFRYMAQAEHGVARSVWLALPFVFTKGALERRALASWTKEDIRTEMLARDVLELRVDLALVEDLRGRLEALHRCANDENRITHPDGSEYVVLDRRYNLWGFFGVDNCNGAVVEWLRELGCEVPRRFPRWGGWASEGRSLPSPRLRRPSSECV